MTKPSTHLLTAIALLALSTMARAQPSSCHGMYLEDQTPRIVNQRLYEKARELCYDDFAVVHSGVTRTPLWSAEHLTGRAINVARATARTESFHPEQRLPYDERAELADFARSGYDRGHMAPSGDMPGPRAQEQSFTLANIVPQDPDNNRHLWESLESSVRALAEHEGELFVITGPLFKGRDVQILNDRVLVPTHLFKAVYDPRAQAGAAYVVKNERTQSYDVISLTQLQDLAGIDFFPQLTPAQKSRMLTLSGPNRNSKGYRE